MYDYLKKYIGIVKIEDQKMKRKKRYSYGRQ